MICAKASKFDLIEQYSNLTLSTIVSEKYPSICSLERMHGKESIQKVMSVIIADLSSSFQGDLNMEEIQEVVVEIRSSLTKNITLEGLFLTCSQLKRTTTFKLKIPTVLKAVNEHLEEQTQAVMSANYNKHLQHKQREPRDRYDSSKDEKFSQFKAEYFKRNLEKSEK